VEIDDTLSKFLNWHLFKGGIRRTELEASPEELIDYGLKEKYKTAEDQFE
jgi:hypothetical protein